MAESTVDPLFSLEERLLLALLYLEGPKTAAQVAHHFRSPGLYTGADMVPLDLSSAERVENLLAELNWSEGLTEFVAGKWKLREKPRQFMQLAGAVTTGGLLGVLHG